MAVEYFSVRQSLDKPSRESRPRWAALSRDRSCCGFDARVYQSFKIAAQNQPPVADAAVFELSCPEQIVKGASRQSGNIDSVVKTTADFLFLTDYWSG